MRRYPFENVVNLRDLGGFPISLTACTEFGRILRSDAPLVISSQERQFLLDMNIKTIVDLRGTDEIQRNPCVFADMAEFDYHNYFFKAGSSIWRTEDDISSFYLNITEDEIMAQIMRTILNSEHGSLVHCAAGKDRTGVVCALILLLSGVSVFDVLADYQVTHTYLYEKIKGFLRDSPDLPAFAVRSEVGFMKTFLDAFYEKYHSVYEYFNAYLGLSEDEIDRLKAKLLTKK